MSFNKFIVCFIAIIVMTSGILAGFSFVGAGDPTLIVFTGANGTVVVEGVGWALSTQVLIYWDTQTPSNLLATVTTSPGGNLLAVLPPITAVSEGTHTVIAVQGTTTESVQYTVTSVVPPDDRLVSQINVLQTSVNQILNCSCPQLNEIAANITNIQNQLSQCQIFDALSFNWSGSNSFTFLTSQTALFTITYSWIQLNNVFDDVGFSVFANSHILADGFQQYDFGNIGGGSGSRTFTVAGTGITFGNTAGQIWVSVAIEAEQGTGVILIGPS